MTNKRKCRIFVKLLLTVRRGTGLVSDGELCFDIVRYEAVRGADFCSWCALCRNVVVRDGAIQLIDYLLLLSSLGDGLLLSRHG